MTGFFRRIVGRLTRKPDRLLDECERLVEHRFANRSLLHRALIHRSYLPTNGKPALESNEVLEFLGDAVLELVVVEHLYRRFPDKREGDLSKLKALLVSGSLLNQVGAEIQLGRFILMSENEERNGGRARCSILEDTMEAIIGALYLDGGIKPAKRFIEKYIISKSDDPVTLKAEENHKSILLEYSQARGMGAPLYKTVSEEGPDHCKHFEVEVYIGDQLLGRGGGNNKKSAQQNAAAVAVAFISNQST